MHVRGRKETWPVWDSSTPPGGSWSWTAAMEVGYMMAVYVSQSSNPGNAVEEFQSQGSTILDSQVRACDFMGHIATGKLPTPVDLTVLKATDCVHQNKANCCRYYCHSSQASWKSWNLKDFPALAAEPAAVLVDVACFA